jgi:hypothetical protein
MARALLAIVTLVAALQTPPAPGFSVTFDGGIFKNQTFSFKPIKATYANNVWRSKRDERVNRIVLQSEAAADGLYLQFGAAPKPGVTAFDRRDEDDPRRNPYLRFEIHAEDWTLARGYRLDLVHVDVTVTKLDPPGGRIEGTFKGAYELCTLPGNGGGNCTARTPLAVAGAFSVVRGKDRGVE